MQAITLLVAFIMLFGLSNAAPINIQKRTNCYPWVIFPGDPEYNPHGSLWDGGSYIHLTDVLIVLTSI